MDVDIYAGCMHEHECHLDECAVVACGKQSSPHSGFYTHILIYILVYSRPHTQYTRIYRYIYMCVCVCVCV